jgi:hypothetical protein
MKNKFVYLELASLITLLFSACTHEITPGQLSEGPRAVDRNAMISGTVEAAPGITLDGSGTLYIIARSKDRPFGPPLAAKNFPDPVLPIEFEMGQDNVMIMSNVFSGNINLTARWDQDGNPLSTQPGDVTADIVEGVPVGTKGIKIILNKKVE